MDSTTKTEKTTEKYRSGEVADSITGHDEVAIEKAFGKTLEGLADTGGGMFLRGLLFAAYCHEGKSAAEAYKAVMDLSLKQLREQFEGDGDEDPALPGSEAGKGKP